MGIVHILLVVGRVRSATGVPQAGGRAKAARGVAVARWVMSRAEAARRELKEGMMNW